MFIFCVNGFLEKNQKMKKNHDHFLKNWTSKIFIFEILKKVNSQTFSDLLSKNSWIVKKSENGGFVKITLAENKNKKNDDQFLRK